MVWLYRVPICCIGPSTRRPRPVVTHVLVHEIGHHFGMSDEDMERIERAAESRGHHEDQRSCQCGFITFEGEADPEKAWVCHCTDCQAGTGTAFRFNVPVPGASFRLNTGTLTTFIKTTAESGTPRAQTFCPKCGSPVYSTTVDDGPRNPDTVRIGLLREREVQPKRQNWFRSAMIWTGLASVQKNEKQG